MGKPNLVFHPALKEHIDKILAKDLSKEEMDFEQAVEDAYLQNILRHSNVHYIDKIPLDIPTGPWGIFTSYPWRTINILNGKA